MALGRSRSRAMVVGMLAVASVLLFVPGAAHGVPDGDKAEAKAACKRGGWRTLLDDEGRPFRNQGQCVAAAARGRVRQDPNLQVSGPFTGTSNFDFGDACNFVRQVFDGTYTAASGSGSFRTDGCTDIDTSVVGDFWYEGSFTLQTPNGSTLSGRLTGTVFPLDFTLTVEDASGPLAGVTGTVELDGTWEGGDGGAISGTLTGALAF